MATATTAALGNFEIQMITLGSAMDWDSLLDGMANGLFSTHATGAGTLRFKDGAGNELRLIGTFSDTGGTVNSCLYFEDSVRTARMALSEPIAVDSVIGILPFMEQSFRSDASLVLRGGKGIDELTGGVNDDSLDGRGGKDGLHGKSGNDLLYGRDGNDFLSGGDGDDTCYGGAGNDVLVGGAGTNRLNGGADADLFVFDKDLGAAHTDIILGYTEIEWTYVTGNYDASSPYIALMSSLDPNATSLADFDADVLADLGFKLKETANGSAVIDFGGGERIRFNKVGLESIDPHHIVLGDRPLADAIAVINNAGASSFWYDEPWG